MLGELAVNTTDGKLFLKKGDNTIVQVGEVASAETLTGATLASNVLASSLTSVGTLTAVNTSGLIATTSDTIRIATQKTPASATATGTKGDIVHDINYIYVCIATDTWKRVAITTW